MTEMQKGRIQLLLAGMATFFLMGALQAVYGPALPVIARETGRAVADVSILFTVHWVGSAAGVAAMFALGRRMTPRMLVAVMALGAVLLGLGWGWPVTLLGASLAGFGQGCAAVVFNPRLLALFGRRGPAMLSMINAIFGAGAILAPLAFVMMGGAYGLVFLAVGVALLIVAAGAQDVGRPPVETSTAPLRADWAILAFGAFGIGFEAVLIGLGPSALVRNGYSEAAAAEFLSAFFMAFLLARTVLTFAAHRIAPFTLYALSISGVAVSMLLALALPPGWPFVVAGAFASLIFPAYFVEGMARMGHGPRVSPLIIAGGLVGGIGMPFVLARVAEVMGPNGLFLLLAGLASATAVVALIVLIQRSGARTATP